MSADIRSFLIRSIADQDGDHHSMRDSKGSSKSADPTSGIASILGFQHHIGTDSSIELKVVKIILVREGLIMSLKHLNDKIMQKDIVDKACTNVLELLSQIRESTLNYLEALCLWRQSGSDDGKHKPFMWEKKNYTLKIVTDLDFLASNNAIVEALSIPPFQLLSNPLMLTNNLDDPNTWIDPFERASLDVDGATEGTHFESRLRLRFAERILLQEVEVSNEPVIESGGYEQIEGSEGSEQYGAYNNTQSDMVKGSKALQDFEDDRYSNQGMLSGVR